MSDLDVFVSVGSTSNAIQERFVRTVEDRLRSEGLNPRTVGRNTFSADAPMKTVEHLMDNCVGAVVIALERTYFASGVEKRGGDKQTSLSDIRLPTPWNHIEAAMAYSRGLPLLVIVEHGLKSEGLLEHGYDWYVQSVDLDQSSLTSLEFNGVLASWRSRLGENPSSQERSAMLTLDPAELTIGQLIGALKPKQFWALLVSCLGLVGGAFALGAKLIGM